ncbi:uncharacterized protein LOC127852190 [Dreissena polymorpha]|uniref:uncharacterized protein LOC127852190 n=1 Tax=Dreissena polymorpha TaxID=45954 RepID=UPI002263EC2A|nr:uncharacterized protein LOC127852190 [Dreissena polymorpha]XP_052242035.1 uncharacterized protein LOC127852190 [Dreissena polymorpha]
MMASYHLSDDGCQRVLSRAHNDLVLKINVDTALNFLGRFLEVHDADEIKNLFTNEAKCRVLMRRIGKGGVKTYRKFKEYLASYHSDLLKTLEKHEEELTMEHPENEVVNSNTNLTDVHLARIALQIRHQFDPTAANLRIAEQTIQDIKKHYSYSNYEQVYQFLYEWKEQNKADATFGFLITKLQKCPGLWSLRLSDFGRQTLEDDGDERNFQNISTDITITMKKDLYDGWLIYLQKQYIDKLKRQSRKIYEGHDTSVFITDRKIDTFTTRLAIKQITKPSVYRTIIDAQIIKETYVAKILHFGIVPLIAHHEDKVNE